MSTIRSEQKLYRSSLRGKNDLGVKRILATEKTRLQSETCAQILVGGALSTTKCTARQPWRPASGRLSPGENRLCDHTQGGAFKR
jgi:hypothetical protein